MEKIFGNCLIAFVEHKLLFMLLIQISIWIDKTFFNGIFTINFFTSDMDFRMKKNLDVLSSKISNK